MKKAILLKQSGPWGNDDIQAVTTQKKHLNERLRKGQERQKRA